MVLGAKPQFMTIMLKWYSYGYKQHVPKCYCTFKLIVLESTFNFTTSPELLTGYAETVLGIVILYKLIVCRMSSLPVASMSTAEPFVWINKHQRCFEQNPYLIRRRNNSCHPWVNEDFRLDYKLLPCCSLAGSWCTA